MDGNRVEAVSRRQAKEAEAKVKVKVIIEAHRAETLRKREARSGEPAPAPRLGNSFDDA